MELEERKFTVPPVDGDVTIRQPLSMKAEVDAYMPVFEAVVRDFGWTAEILSGDLYED